MPGHCRVVLLDLIIDGDDDAINWWLDSDEKDRELRKTNGYRNSASLEIIVDLFSHTDED